MEPIVLKIGGHELDNPTFLDQLAAVIAKQHGHYVIVHGGGKEISQLQEKLGVRPQYVDGLRVSDETSLRIAEMVLCGTVNTRIVSVLLAHGVEAQGMRGADRGLIQVRKLQHPKGDLGRVGEPVAVRGDILQNLLWEGVLPVIAPICLGPEGTYNVNADHVAHAVASAIGARKVVFITNVPGILDNGALLPNLTPDSMHHLETSGVIHGGMLPKVHAARRLLDAGIPQIWITNLDGMMNNTGTVISPSTPLM